VLIQKGEALLTGFFKRIGLTEFRLNWTLPNVARGWGNHLINFVYLGAASVTAASGSGTVHTYTCANTYQAGQIVSVTGLSPAGYNVSNATILTASATQFTVAGTTTGVSSGTGTATIGYTASVTAATAVTAGGVSPVTTITYTAANSFSAGQLLRQVTGLSPAGFNVTNLRIASASPTQFSVVLPVSNNALTTSTGTGTALVGLTRQIVMADGFYNTLSMAQYLAQNVATYMPGFTANVSDYNEDQIRFLPPIDTAAPNYEFYFDPVNTPVQYGRGLVTAATGSGTAVTYTCNNAFVVGQTVTVSGLNTTTGSSLNLTGTITSATSSQFVIASTVVGTASGTQAGTATADARAIYPNVSINNRQLIDMLSLPTATRYYGDDNLLFSGIPNMRATDYIDVICNQLTMNQNLRDTSSLPAPRDVMARIYLDDGTPSQYNVETKTYSTTAPPTFVLTALQSVTENVAIFTTSTVVTAAIFDTPCVISGITGGDGWNGTGTVVATDTTSPYAIAVAYDGAPSGVPAFSASSSLLSYAPSSISKPATVWDDRMNGVSPFVIYRQFQNPKQIRWSSKQPLANCVFELYDDQGRSIQDLFNAAYPLNVGGVLSQTGTAYANSFVWNATCLLSED
jgi:hypothetical protein